MEQNRQIKQCALSLLYDNLVIHKNTREDIKTMLKYALDNVDKLADLFEITDSET